MKRAVFPGTFDPITNGHVGVIKKSLRLFDEVVVAIGVNVKKSSLFSIEHRRRWIEAVFVDEPRVKVMSFEGLTVNFCKSQGIQFVIRGLRNSTDFEYEQAIAHANAAMAPEIETIFVVAPSNAATISSSIVREIIKSGGDYSHFVPKVVCEQN
ncbi:MAG: pantetheine-phosphate adenylyltransferase [Bacteroidia bacterium]|nr:pantetheine-phosphate adenylyltransferase [Bacteroidia bacterium]